MTDLEKIMDGMAIINAVTKVMDESPEAAESRRKDNENRREDDDERREAERTDIGQAYIDAGVCQSDFN